MLKELPQKGLLNLQYILNAIIRLEYWPKQAQIIMIPKPGKNPIDVTSYRPISLLSTISKILEKLILKRINRVEPTWLDSKPSVWIQTGSLYKSTMPSSGRHHQQSTGKPSVLHSSLSRCQPGIWQSMAPRTTLQNKKNSPHKIFQLTEIIPTGAPIRNEIQ